MSGTGSKRSHEESGNSSGSQTHKTYTHDDLGEYHGIPKISRSESRDSDRRSSPQVPIFTRVSSNDSTHPPPPVTTGLDYINREGARLDDNKDRIEEQRSWPRTIIHGPEAEKKEFDDETVGENRIDLKEKERKKREGKHREYKDTMKEERDVESIVKKESVKEIQTTEPLINIDNTKESDEIQQRRRIVRPRGSPHTNRFKDNNNNNNQGKGDVTSSSSISSVIYRVGECMQVLIKLWKEYKSLDGNCEEGPTLEICIPAEHVSATNRQVRGGQLWGTDIYTNDSDVVAVLMHTGYCRPTASPPPVTIQELRATIRVLPPLDCYVSTLRNNVRSRAWGSAIGCSYRIERCVIVKKNGGGSIDLQPCLTQSSTLEPTLAPVAVERTMTTRAAASNALRQQRFVREVTIQFNLCHEPWLKYSISVVADKGLKKPLFASSRLKMGEVLYVETHTRRYELCFNGEKTVKVGGGADNQTLGGGGDTEMGNGDGENTVIDVFRWSLCKKPLPQKYMRTIGIPLPLEQLEVLEDNVEWDEIHWSQTGVWIGGKEYQLARAHFLSQN